MKKATGVFETKALQDAEDLELASAIKEMKL